VNKVFQECVGAPEVNNLNGNLSGKDHSGMFYPGDGYGMYPRHHARFFASNGQFQFPLVSVKDEQKQLTVFIDLPGVKKENVKLEVSQGRLTISGNRQREPVNTQNNGTWFMDERFFGNFTRSIRLPRNVNENQISARLVDGVLHVAIPTEVLPLKQIPIA